MVNTLTGSPDRDEYPKPHDLPKIADKEASLITSPFDLVFCGLQGLAFVVVCQSLEFTILRMDSFLRKIDE